jgi:hypothetical protein
LAELTRTENRTGSRYKGIIRAEGVFAGRHGCPGDIIHVAGVRVGSRHP